MAVFLKLPFPVVQGADLPRLQPPGNAVKVESMVADSPGNSALVVGSRNLIGLTLNAEVHNMVSADGAVIHHNVPCPQCHRVPFLHLESFLLVRFDGGATG